MAIRIIKRLSLLLVSLYVLLLGYLYVAQRSFIYLPEYTRSVSVPVNYELQNAGLSLKGWAMNATAKDAIIYFGGNGEAVEHNLSGFRRMFADRAVYLVAYRGYGSSEGEPSEAGIYSDALALYDAVRARHGSISIIGRSLGSGVATYVAANRLTDRLVLVTPFDSLENVARSRFPIVPVGLLLQDRYMSLERAKQIKARTLIIYAGSDQVVSEASTRNLIVEFMPEQLTVKRIVGAGHNSISNFEEYEKGLQGFLITTD